MSCDDFALVHDHISMPLVSICPIGVDGPSEAFYALTNEERMFLAMWHLEAEVSNGGFLQFYLNTGGWLDKHALAGYDAVGLPEHAAIVREAIQIVAKETTVGAANIRAKLGELVNPTFFEAYDALTKASRLPALDDMWYALDRRSNGWAAKATFARAHRAELPNSSLETEF